VDAEGIRELFEPVGAVQLKRMFGSHGIYREGRIVALEADGMIWLKADETSRPAFEAAGSRPFTYDKKGGGVTAMSYWLLPEAAFDDPDLMRQWARSAEEAADRAAAKVADKSTSKPKKPRAKPARKA
jgi:DNA transformation protein and related proteins